MVGFPLVSPNTVSKTARARSSDRSTTHAFSLLGALDSSAIMRPGGLECLQKITIHDGIEVYSVDYANPKSPMEVLFPSMSSIDFRHRFTTGLAWPYCFYASVFLFGFFTNNKHRYRALDFFEQ